ncbi:hypothetical protein [Nocardioides sp. B-3]|uniref:hypothetical protein n=1 Tax=Nocardioides sp. B-3 TaxID=2895565 RepID=UPI00215269EE|nr:hypothetical protein [Nocardioides sp. B-3]UUZ59218.1 hypothetical protein LP418_25480 [Nocardioides sp. B-3]
MPRSRSRQPDRRLRRRARDDGPGGAAATVDGFYATAIVMLALMAAGFAISSALRPRGEEEDGRVEAPGRDGTVARTLARRARRGDRARLDAGGARGGSRHRPQLRTDLG